jgi:rubrerythrin
MERTIKGTQTEKNLLKAFAGESQARNRYTMYAEKAREEGYEQIAAIFEVTANQELSHAKRFYSFLEGGPVEITAKYPAGTVDTTKVNLLHAAEGEKEEWEDLYPEFARTAEEEGFKKVATLFKLVAKAEITHEYRYRKLLENMEHGKVFERQETVKWYCRKCGYIHEGTKALKNCPCCLYPQSYFEVMSENY